MTSAEYQRAYRARKGARTGQLGRPPTQPCGTVAAYRRHRRAGEEPCDLCRSAYSDRQRQLYQQRKEARRI